MAQLRALISAVSAAAILVAVAVAPVAANTTTIDPANCTRAMRDTLNPDTGLPYCVKVALLRDGASSAPYYTNILPRRVFDNALLDANPTTAVSIEATELIWEQGIDAVRNGTYDVFVANIWVLRRRVRYVDFSSAFLIETLSLVYRKPSSGDTSFTAIFSPLQWTLWLGVCITMLITAIVLVLSELAHPSSATPGENPLADRKNLPQTFRRCFFHAINVPFGTMEHVPASSAGKLISWMMAFFFLIVIATYTANLASTLTVVSAGNTVTQDSLLAKPVLAGPGDTAPFIEALGGQVKSVGFGDVSAVGLDNHPEAGSVVMSQNNALAETYTTCDVAMLRLDIPIDSALVFRQQDSVTRFKRKMDEAILRLKEVGVLDRWSTGGLPNRECTQAGELSSAAMSFSQLSGVFLITGVVMGIVLLFSIVRFLACRHKDAPKTDDEEADAVIEVSSAEKTPGAAYEEPKK
uniref:Ionotropic glutamate receptor C-terminal domain-containing protein n=1 Tax=Neobodo designis TaxID=312471 RepID=A0A7S1R5Q9_NEODS|mmetsp:Transcript_8638/g.26892  ORF Transcript_8638/g.26892 Transcript_8638/m.26892 type:complete len:466 (+) Transcript_8638:56-1453(+)